MWRRLGPVSLLVAALAGGAEAEPASADGSTSASAAASAPAEGALLSDAQLGRLLGELRQDSVEERRAAAKAIVGLGEDAVPAELRQLAELRRPGEAGLVAALRPARERAAKDPTFDLVEFLVQQASAPIVSRALAIACVMRALAHAGKVAAVEGIVPLAADLGAAFRPEVTRLVKQLGDRAVAPLLEARHEPSSEVRSWSTSQLEALGKRTPGDMVQTSDSQVIADVLRAYGSLRDLDALPVVLSFVNSDHATVRAAARAAPLAGGEAAGWELRQAYVVLTGDQAPEGSTAADLAKKLFDTYDRYRLEEVYALLDDGLAKEKAHDWKGAIGAFDEVLARQPMLDRRAEMAPGYAEYGESLIDSDPASARSSLRRAIRLDASGDRTKHAESILLTLEGEDLLARGIADAEPFEQALALDASNAKARAELDRLRAQVGSGRRRFARLVLAGVLLVAALVGAVVFGGKRRATYRTTP